jgi:uncharacterized protein YndB with AHSA1/START domain
MIANKQPGITKNLAKKQMIVVREFDAPLEQVWEAWTDSTLLDQWWAPRPWKANTRSMDFREGGAWLYNMEGPDGSVHYCRVDFQKINIHKNFTTQDVFTDEKGNTNTAFPAMQWYVNFRATEAGTTVTVELNFSSEADLEKILEMGFEQGFTMALGNLDELLAA